MKIEKLSGVLVLAAMAAVLGGCSTANVSFRNFPTTTFAEVPLGEDVSVRVVVRNGANDAAKVFAKALSRELSGNNGLRIAQEGETADYWFLVDGATDFRSDTAQQLPFNTFYTVNREEDENGGSEEVVREDRASYTAACGLNIAVYRTDGLVPVHYIELPLWDGRLGSYVEPGDAKAKAMEVRLAKLALERVKDMFLTQTKTVSIPVPRDTDRELYNEFLKLDKAAVANDAAGLAKAIAAIEKRAAAILPDSIDAFGEMLKTKEWEGREKEAEAILGNYYIRALAREAGCLDPQTLREIHAEQLRILELSTMDSLRMACPIALARIEYKLGSL